MKTIYVIQSNDYISIKENINNILKDNNVSNDCLIKYDLSNTLIEDVIEDLDTYNFLVEKKVIVCDNAWFLTGSKTRGMIEQNVDSFTKYLNNPSSENILILICDKLDERKSIVKLLKEKATFIDNEISINKIIKSRLEDFKMEDYVIKYFIEYCGNDNEKILNELEKLKCYKYSDKIITYDDIDSIVLKTFNDNVFSLIDAIMNKNKKKAIKLYEDLLNNGEDINKILSLLADQFRMIYNGKILLKEYNNNYKEVASILDIHPYRFQKSIESSYNYSLKDVLKYLEMIDDIEIDIKTGKSTIVAFEMFIYSL
ncbi:MAG: DNA polymerase III subunit delta [Bacilli bacterium]|nr:DNA polymerase III subunit delta [Bacilli bacterium]